MPPTRDVNAKVIDDLVKKDINENNAMIFSKSGYPYCTKVCFILCMFFFIIITNTFL
jgi:hypothetical protein